MYLNIFISLYLIYLIKEGINSTKPRKKRNAVQLQCSLTKEMNYGRCDGESDVEAYYDAVDNDKVSVHTAKVSVHTAKVSVHTSKVSVHRFKVSIVNTIGEFYSVD